jgi:hypothetical protein
MLWLGQRKACSFPSSQIVLGFSSEVRPLCLSCSGSFMSVECSRMCSSTRAPMNAKGGFLLHQYPFAITVSVTALDGERDRALV